MSDAPNNTEWTDAAASADLRADDVVAIQVAGREVALYCVEGDVFATDNLCSHGQARLCEGFLLGHEIECPLHQGRFDIRTGEPQCAPVTAAIRSYPVRVVDGRVLLALR